jgi:hypothetical protein
MTTPTTSSSTSCPAHIWHGPAHMTRTGCELGEGHVGPHRAAYGTLHVVAVWTAWSVYSGRFDDPPES